MYEYEDKITIKNEILTSVVDNDETSVDFKGLEILPGGSKESIHTQLPPAKTQFPPHVTKFLTKIDSPFH